ncbi:MAG: isoprenylcysteine carboxylmethyltransferase family protein [Steroidobacteraceae bacterium]
MSALVKHGDFWFRHRGALLPISIVLLLIPSPALAPDPLPVGLAGLGIAVAGQLIRCGTIGLVYIIRGGKDHKVHAETLVTQGLYNHVRNPMYLGNFFLIAGFALASNRWLFLIAGTAIALYVHRAIVAAEEHFLRDRFGAPFDDYCARVPRFLPRLAGLATTLRGHSFDSRRVIAQEYQKPFGWPAMIAAVVIINIWRAGLWEPYRPVVIGLAGLIILRFVLWRRALALRRAAAAGPA